MITSMIGNFVANSVFAVQYSYAALGTMFGNIMLQTGAEQNIWAFYEETLKPIFNIIIVVLAAFGAFKVIMKLVQGDEGAGKLIIVILGGLLIWFAILPPILESAHEGDLFGN